MPKVIPPYGPIDAPVVILASHPDAPSAYAGRPLEGAIGDLFYEGILGPFTHLRRDTVLTLYTYWEMPPSNNLARASQPDRYHEDVWNILSQHPRAIIIPLGETPLQFLTTLSGITKWRGSILRSSNLTAEVGAANIPPNLDRTSYGAILPMLDPAAILRQYAWKAYGQYDAQRLSNLLDDPAMSDTPRHILHKDSCAGSSEILHALESYRDTAETIAFDIETYANTITCIGVANATDHAVVVPLTADYTWKTTAQMVTLLKEILEGPSRKIGQNLDYDVQYLWRCLGIGVNNVWIDTMVAHSTIHPELDHDLATLTSIYTLRPYFKEMRKETGQATYDATAWEYNGLDCCVTYEIGHKLHDEIEEAGVTVFSSISMPAQLTLTRMQNRGIRIDETLRNTRHASMDSEVETLLAHPDLAGINPNSPKQIKDHFLQHLPQSLQPKGTDVHQLKSLRRRGAPIRKHEHIVRFIDALLDVRKKRKIISTYLKAKLSNDRRMRTSYRTSATETGRISSSSDVFNTGMNLQNVPASQRDWFIPDDGYIFWECDASQIEARITAYLSQDEDFVTGFLEGRDFHAENAVALFGCAPGQEREKIPNSTMSYRDAGKRITHSVNYGVGARKIVEMVKEAVPSMAFTERDAQIFLYKFERRRPGVVRWWHDIETRLRDNDRIFYTPFGRRRIFLSRLYDDQGRFNQDLLREAIAYVPQSTAADHINRSLVAVERRIHDENINAHLLVQVHDSIGGQVHPEHLDHLRAIVVEELERPLPLEWNGDPLIVPADFASGPTWADCK